MKKNLNNFDIWWQDGENKLLKIIKLFFSWWNDGNNKLLKAVYCSLFFHIIVTLFWNIFKILY